MRKRLAAVLAVAMLAVLGTQLIAADGTEMLGPPSIAIADGTDVISAGTGLVSQPGTIDFTVPAGATVKQVLFYWEGFFSSVPDTELRVNGIAVTGTPISERTTFFGFTHSQTHRADITALGLVGPGANSLTITDMDFNKANNGAGVLVIVDDGSDRSIEIRDGNDLAFINFAAPLDTTVPQTFNFAASGVDRVALLDMFFSSVEGEESGAGDVRPTSIEVDAGAGPVLFSNLLNSGDEDEWDTIEVSVNVPAGSTSLTVQAHSRDDLATGHLPASFAWTAAALSLDNEERQGGEGCTPGYWKQPHHFDSWTTYDPSDDYETVFGVDASFTLTLLGALEQGGGKEKALGRHATAALLNTASSGVNYDFTEAEVIAMVQAAYATGKFNKYKDMLADANEAGCGLN